MRRTKEWWNKLNESERHYIWWYERLQSKNRRSSYLPVDTSVCSICGNPTLGISPCSECMREYYKIIDKANKNKEQ